MWKRLNPGGGRGLKIPVISHFYSQEEIVNWLIKKIEAVKKEFECKVSKCLKQIRRKLFNFVIFSILVCKNFGLSTNWREKKVKFTFSYRK